MESDNCVGVGMEVVHEICAFCLSVGCCFLLLAANLVEGYEAGGVNTKAVVKEGFHYHLDALFSVRREKWRGRRLGGPLLRSLAVYGGCPVVRGVLWAFGGFVVEFIEGLTHVARHGDVDVFFGIVPGEGEATVLCSFPID